MLAIALSSTMTEPYSNLMFCPIRYRKTRSPAALAPVLPLTFLTSYQADLAYGTKVNRIQAEAESILMFERDLVEMPGGLPTVSSLDVGRMQQEENAKYHPPISANDK